MSELSHDARALIDQVRSEDTPRGEDRARIRSKLVGALGAQAFASAAVSSATIQTSTVHAGATAGRTSAGAKLGNMTLLSKGLAVLGAAGAASLVYFAGAGLVSPEVEPRVPSAQEHEAKHELPARPSAEGASVVPAHTSEAERTAHEGHAPAAAASDEPESHLRRTAHKRSRASRSERPAPSTAGEVRAAEAAKSVPQASSLSAELTLLARAERALRERRASDALLLAREHASAFPSGSLSEERDGVETLARCMLGELSPAGAKAFLERAPSSPVAARVRKECGLE